MSNRSIIWTIDKDELQEIFRQEQTLKGTIKRIGLSYGGTSSTALRKRLEQDGVDISCIYGNTRTIIVQEKEVKVRKCSRCREYKPLSEFCRKGKTGRSSYCRQCKLEYQREHYQKNKAIYKAKAKERKESLKQWVRNYKLSLACANCGETYVECLDFHHRDPKEKDFTVSQMALQGFSIERIQEEIAKCDILCANCHRRLHAEEDKIGT